MHKCGSNNLFLFVQAPIFPRIFGHEASGSFLYLLPYCSLIFHQKMITLVQLLLNYCSLHLHLQNASDLWATFKVFNRFYGIFYFKQFSFSSLQISTALLVQHLGLLVRFPSWCSLIQNSLFSRDLVVKSFVLVYIEKIEYFYLPRNWVRKLYMLQVSL